MQDYYVSVIDDFSVLDPFTSNGLQVTVCSSIISDPLGDNGDSRVGINGFSWSIKFFISKTESSPIATILITDTIVSIYLLRGISLSLNMCIVQCLSLISFCPVPYQVQNSNNQSQGLQCKWF